MRVVMLEVPWDLLEERQRLGHDRCDEVWEGDIHMVPSPHAGHGRLNDDLGVFFKIHWERLGLGRTYLEANVERPGAGTMHVGRRELSRDFRVPDRCFLLPDRYDRAQKNGWILGGPDAVIEILSPGDESREKLPWYFAIGVREVILIDHATRKVEIHRAGASGIELVPEDAEGWSTSEVLRTRLRQEIEGPSFFLHLRRSDEPSRELRIGE
jgi:Uma2 family endonuclease